MKLFDYAPHILFKDDYYRRFQGQFLNIRDALGWLQQSIMTDQAMKIFKSAGYVPKNTALKSIPMQFKWRGEHLTEFHIVCEFTDFRMYKRYAANELRDSLCIKYFKNGPWPFMRPILIYGPEILYEYSVLQIRSWAKEHLVMCMGNHRSTLEYIELYGKSTPIIKS